MQSPLKKMIYIWPENLEFYNDLPNKSDLINRFLMQKQKEQLPGQLDIETELDRKLKRLNERAAKS